MESDLTLLPLGSRLVASLDGTSVLQLLLTSHSMRHCISAHIDIVVVLMCREEELNQSHRLTGHSDLRGQRSAALQTAAEVAGIAAFPISSNIGGWAIPWQVGLNLPRCIDWRVARWQLAASCLRDARSALPSLQAELGYPLLAEELCAKIAVLGTPWAPLCSPLAEDDDLPCLRRVYASPLIAPLWPASRPLRELLITGPLAEAKVHASGVRWLRLAGTTPEDLLAIDDLAPNVLELEISPTQFETAAYFADSRSQDSNDTHDPFWDVMPAMHVAPDAARFSSLQRLQAELDPQMLVLSQNFIKNLPHLRRLGTLITDCEAIHQHAHMANGLEEFVVFCILDHELLEIASGRNSSTRTQEVIVDMMKPCLVSCSYVHVCCAPSLSFEQRFTRIANDDPPHSHGANLDRCLRISVQSKPAESTPLNLPVNNF
eukprot:TRINITY_DN12346_c0_g1_i1.p1 TRINITY_DN12346_c0_g1~~TRINITY_DN12346_c0_g1_i1.p1  ORF type:complete len:465 (-),score=41.00 TRINITY_DN12346_c0_g1_i1:180-1475(-)